MIPPDLALQKAIRGRLVGTPAVSALVPAEAIFDRNTRPERYPCVVIGEAQTVAEPITFSRRHVRVTHTLHVWAQENATTSAKGIAGAVRSALRSDLTIDDHRVLDHQVTGIRVMRDPAGTLSHAVVTLEALVEETL